MSVATRSLLDVVRLSTGYLKERGSGSPRLDAELLAAHALGLRRLDLYLQFDRPLDDVELARIRELVRRRSHGEPVAQILGEREFYGRPFTVTSAVLIPRPETELLVERALAAAGGRPAPVIADLGTGSGCIAVTLAAEMPGAEVWATDVSPDALAVAAGNAERHGVASRVHTREGSWAEPLPPAVTHAVSNPPYVSSAEMDELIPDVRDYEPRLALEAGGDGLDCYRQLLESLHRRCPALEWIGLEVDPRRVDGVVALLRERWPGAEPVAVDDLTHRPRVVDARLR